MGAPAGCEPAEAELHRRLGRGTRRHQSQWLQQAVESSLFGESPPHEQLICTGGRKHSDYTKVHCQNTLLQAKGLL